MANIILAEQNYNGFRYDSTYGAYAFGLSESPCELQAEEKYIVSWDGVEYTCTAHNNESLGYLVVYIGDGRNFGGEGADEPFLIVYTPQYNSLYMLAKGASTSHTVSISQEGAGCNIVLYDRTGAPVTYKGVEEIVTDTEDGGTAKFQYGDLLKGTVISLSLADGDQKVSVPDGYFVKEATIKKPDTLIPDYIKKNIEIAGVVGDFAGDEAEKTVELNFAVSDVEISSQEEMETFRADENNIGKSVHYNGENGEYMSNSYYRLDEAYEDFEADKCSMTATETSSGTTLSSSISCKVGDLIIAAFVIRSDLVSLSDGWTLIDTSQDQMDINNNSSSVNQTLSYAYKYATATTETLTVTQTSAARIYINMVAITGASGFIDHGFQYQNNATVSDATSATFTRPSGEIVIWSVARSMWSSGKTWTTSEDLTMVESSSSTSPRLLLALDTTETGSITFTTGASGTTDVYICGCLSVQLQPVFKSISSNELTVNQQVIEADEETVLTKVTVLKPETLVPENIASGVNIAGFVGTCPKPVRPKAINFYNAEGDLIYSYSRAEAKSLTELPPVPELEGFEVDSWTHTLDDVKNAEFFADVGPVYNKDGVPVVILILDVPYEDLTTRLALYTWGGSTSSSLQVYWGDGEYTSVSGSSSNTNRLLSHTYAEGGRKYVYIKTTQKVCYGLGKSETSSAGYPCIYVNAVSGSATSWVASRQLVAVLANLSPLISNFNFSLFKTCCNLRFICFKQQEGSSSMITTTGMANYTFQRCEKLEHIASRLPLAFSIYTGVFKESGIKRMISTSCGGADAFKNCVSLSDLVTSSTTIYNLDINKSHSLILTGKTVAKINEASPLFGTYPVYVNDDLVESYKVADKWNTIADYIKPKSEYPDFY